MKKHLSLLIIPALFTMGAYAEDAAKLTDGQIDKVLITINEGEIEAAKMATKRADKPQVKEFAKMMLDTHNENVKETKKVATENQITAKDSKLSGILKTDAMTANKDLKSAEKAHFDLAYVNQQIMMHEKALQTLNNTLIPAATDPEFKAHLEKTRTAVAEHLDHAQKLKTQLQ
jgi:putative membrane protein